MKQVARSSQGAGETNGAQKVPRRDREGKGNVGATTVIVWPAAQAQKSGAEQETSFGFEKDISATACTHEKKRYRCLGWRNGGKRIHKDDVNWPT